MAILPKGNPYAATNPNPQRQQGIPPWIVQADLIGTEGNKGKGEAAGYVWDRGPRDP